MNTFYKILFVFLFLISWCLAADDLSQMKIVGEPKKVDGEFIGKEMRDVNGQWCAGLIIYSDLKGLEYDANNGIVKRNSDPGKDFLFLSPDEKIVDVFQTEYKSLKIILSEVGIRLKSGEIWAITIVGEKILPVTFIISPNGYKILIDKVEQDMTKAPQLKTGKHIIQISKAGYETLVDTIDVSIARALFTFNLKEKIGAAKREVADYSIPLENTYGSSAIAAKFTSVGGVSSSELTEIRNTFLGAVIQSGKYDVINASEEELTDIQSKVTTGSMSERELSVKIASTKKAGIVFSAAVNRSSSKYVITVNMYDVRTSSLVATKSDSYEGYIDGMSPLVEEVAQKIIGTYEEPSYMWYYIGGAALVGGTAAAILLQPEKVPPPDNSLPLPPTKPSN